MNPALDTQSRDRLQPHACCVPWRSTLAVLSLAGCSGTSAPSPRTVESNLASAGFRGVVPDTPKKQEAIKRLPARKLTEASRSGKRYYWYADPEGCGCVYVGSEAAYQRYDELAQARDNVRSDTADRKMLDDGRVERGDAARRVVLAGRAPGVLPAVNLSYNPEEERFRAELRAGSRPTRPGPSRERLDEWVAYGKAWQRQALGGGLVRHRVAGASTAGAAHRSSSRSSSRRRWRARRRRC